MALGGRSKDAGSIFPPVSLENESSFTIEPKEGV